MGHAQKTGYGTAVSSAGLYVLSTSRTDLFPELCGGDTDVPFMAEHSLATHLHHFGQF